MTQKPIKATLDSSDDSVKTQKPILIQLDDIPTPTSDDAGKVLGVDDEGKYELVQGGGGGIPTVYLSELEELALTSGLVSVLQNANDTLKRSALDIDSTVAGSLYEKLIPFASSPHYGGIVLTSSVILQLHLLENNTDYSLFVSEAIYFNQSAVNIRAFFHLYVHLNTSLQRASMYVIFQNVNVQ